MSSIIRFFAFIVLSLLFSCSEENTGEHVVPKKVMEGPLFEEVKDSGIDFVNKLDIKTLKSTMEFINAYNGGGVGVFDLNNDGLLDVYLTGNQVDNKLYLNKGNLVFEDITEKAGVACANSWSTGVTFGDVNNDGFSDMYVCRSYHDQKVLRTNVLFVNNGDMTFSDKSVEFGVDDSNYSLQASFIDYDKDGYLDLYVGNCPHIARRYFTTLEDEHHTKHFMNPSDINLSDRLYRNVGGTGFQDVTVKAGILNYGYMLGISNADYNNDGWQDIYVAVDHGEPDKLYINNKNGTFTNRLNESFKHISLSSMGTDAVDINNDCLMDLITLDMLSRDHYSEKTQMASMNPVAFQNNVRNGYHYQYMRNMLQLNMGNNKFSEIGQLAGIHKTDWSWSAIAADFDNDSWKDILVTNGYYRSILDKDIKKEVKKKFNEQESSKKRYQILDEFPMMLGEQKNLNVLFMNNGDLTFSENSSEEGITQNGFSSGGIYADFDNDGDQDLIINNIDEPVTILKNTQELTEGNNYIKFKLSNKKIHNVGAKITIQTGDKKQFYEHTISRGYQSAVDAPVIFGLGNVSVVDKIEVVWPDGNVETNTNLKANRSYTFNGQKASKQNGNSNTAKALKEVGSLFKPVYVHKENDFDDYEKQVLLPHKMSQFGPCIAESDINGDGKMDVYIGGAAGQAGTIYLQNENGELQLQSQFKSDAAFEDTGALFFDVDGDKDLDLYVVSGGNEFSENNSKYEDRIYLNEGNAQFKRTKASLPKISGKTVQAQDFDKDGDLDLFIGARLTPWKYPKSASSYLLENNKGAFAVKQEFKDLGMVTDASWEDLNGDGQLDLLVVGEWMPITFLINENGIFKNRTEGYKLPNSKGWWNTLTKVDYDNDGDNDFMIGNLGLNYKYKATVEKPFVVYSGDLDANGSYDIVLGQYYDETLCPVRGRQCSSEQMPEIAEKFKTYDEFGKADLQTVYKGSLEKAESHEVNNFASSILKNEGGGKFSLIAMPMEAQFSTVNDIVCMDLNGDNYQDVIMGGNLYVSEVETGRADAGTGLVLMGAANGEFKPIMSPSSGLYIDKDVKNLKVLEVGQEKILLVANNNDQLQTFKIDPSKL